MPINLKNSGSLIILIIIVIILFITYDTKRLKTIEHFDKQMIEHYNNNISKKNKTEKIKIGSGSYKVQSEYENKKEAAIFMNGIHHTISDFIRKLKIKFPNNPAVNRLDKRFKSNNMIEVDPNNSEGNTSYVVNKGSSFGICLRTKPNPIEFNSDKATMYVILHELSHLASKSYGHNSEFQNNFKFLLEQAEKMGIYHPIDFSVNPVNYCGIMINEKPSNL